MDLIHKFVVLNLFLGSVSSQACYFDFEDDTELLNFDLSCNGQIGSWIIKEKNPLGTYLPDGGERVLTVGGIQTTSCLQSKNMIQLNENQELSVDFFRLKPGYSDPYELRVILKCEANFDQNWDVLTGAEPPNSGDWTSKVHVFSNPKASCKLEVQLYLGNGKAEVEIDRIVLKDLSPSSECYVVPKPDPETTTEEPTSTTETTEISTTDPSTTTESPLPSITNNPTPPTTPDPTVPSTTEKTTTGSQETGTSEDLEVPTSTTIPPHLEYPAFASFYFLVIIATSGSIVFLSLGVCWLLIRKQRVKKDNHLS